MSNFFDYIFYRTHRLYEKWKDDQPFSVAEGIICVIQVFIILDIIGILSIFELFPRKIENPKIYGLISAIIIYFMNHKRYKKKYIDIMQYYDEIGDLNKKRNGYLIFLFIFFVFFFPIIIGILRNNFGYDI